jgi:hypothetical protein
MNRDYESELRDELIKNCDCSDKCGQSFCNLFECFPDIVLSKLKSEQEKRQQAESKESQLLMQTTNQLERTVEKLDKAESKLKKVEEYIKGLPKVEDGCIENNCLYMFVKKEVLEILKS